jgi:NADH-quinone oxidoreductase subunit L
VGRFASNVGDRTIIDGIMVNGSAKLVGFVSSVFRRIQSGYVYHYAFVMIVGVFGLLYWWGVR